MRGRDKGKKEEANGKRKWEEGKGRKRGMGEAN